TISSRGQGLHHRASRPAANGRQMASRGITGGGLDPVPRAPMAPQRLVERPAQADADVGVTTSAVAPLSAIVTKRAIHDVDDVAELERLAQKGDVRALCGLRYSALGQGAHNHHGNIAQPW